MSDQSYIIPRSEGGAIPSALSDSEPGTSQGTILSSQSQIPKQARNAARERSRPREMNAQNRQKSRFFQNFAKTSAV